MKYIISFRTDSDNQAMKHMKGSRLCKFVPRNNQILDRQYDLRRILAFIVRISKSLYTVLMPIWQRWWKLLGLDLRGRAQVCCSKNITLASFWEDENISTVTIVKINGDGKGSKINHLYEEAMSSDSAYDIHSGINKDDKTSTVTLSEKGACECWRQIWRHKYKKPHKGHTWLWNNRSVKSWQCYLTKTICLNSPEKRKPSYACVSVCLCCVLP
jgi:hypothetical protein